MSPRELSRRLEALEADLLPSSEQLTVFRTFVKASERGPIECEPVAITCSHPKTDDPVRWDRSPGEPVEAFRARVKAEAPHNAWGVCVLLDVLE